MTPSEPLTTKSTLKYNPDIFTDDHFRSMLRELSLDAETKQEEQALVFMTHNGSIVSFKVPSKVIKYGRAALQMERELNHG